MLKQVKIAALGVLVAACALPGAAQQASAPSVFRKDNAWIEETKGSLAPAPWLKVTADSGSVRVRGGANQAVTYTVRKIVHGESEQAARELFNDYRVSAARSADSVRIHGSRVSGGGRLSVEIAVDVPRQTSVKVHTQGGHLDIATITGRVDASTAGGHVMLDDIIGEVVATTGGGKVKTGKIDGPLSLTTGGGNMYIGNVTGKVMAHTGGGNVSIASAGGNVEVHTGGGNVDVKQSGGNVVAMTGGGSIEMGPVAGKAALQTGGGNVRLASASGPVTVRTGGGSIELFKLMQMVHAETGAGRIIAEFAGAGAPSGTSHLRSTAGDILVYLPSNLRITVRAAIDMADGHAIRSDFPELKITSEGGVYGPKVVSCEGQVNGGGPVLSVQTMSGDIELRRAR